MRLRVDALYRFLHRLAIWIQLLWLGQGALTEKTFPLAREKSENGLGKISYVTARRKL